MSVFIANLSKFISRFNTAFVMTVEISILSLFFATVIGIIVGVINTSKGKSIPMRILRGIGSVYIFIIRGTPMLVQILIIYYGIASALRPLIGFSWHSIGGTFTAGVVVCSLNAGAYMSEIVRGGIEAVDHGQVEAARSLGLTSTQMMTSIVLPQALRTMMPSIINQFIITIKDTSLLSTIGVAELTNAGKMMASNWSSQVLLLYCTMAVYYLVICSLLAQASKYVEKRMSYGRK